MDKQEKTELLWRVDDLDRRLKASNDLVMFLIASIGCAQPDLSCGVLEQFEEMKKAEDLRLKPELEKLFDRAIEALSGSALDLDGVE